MRVLPALLATTLASAALLAGPAQASDDDFPNVCGDGYTLADTTKIAGPGGHERLGWIVQATNPTTHDACVFVHLKKEKGTTGTATITSKAAAATTAEGQWDTTVAKDTTFDLNAAAFTTTPTYFTYANVNRASTTVAITGKAYQGEQHNVKHTKKVKVSDADKKAAKKKYENELKNAKREHDKSHDKREYADDKKAAKKKYEKACADKTVTTTTTVNDATPFTSATAQSFLLNGPTDDKDDVTAGKSHNQ